MKEVFRIIAFIVLAATLTNCNGQNQTKKVQNKIEKGIQKIVGGGCDGCELMYVDMPENIMSIDTSSGWDEEGQKLLVTGTVYELGGKIPAPGVIIYYWQQITKDIILPMME